MTFRVIRLLSIPGPAHFGAIIGHDPDLGGYHVRYRRAGIPLHLPDYITDSLEDATHTASAELARMAFAESPQAPV